MKIKYLTMGLPVICLILAASATPAAAQELDAVEVAGEVEVDRDADALQADLRSVTDHDRDVVDTALVFNNLGAERVAVACRGFDKNGNYVGGAIARIPGHGLRYLRASDLSNGRDFVGSATCHTTNRVAGESVLLAPGGLTSLRIQQRRLQVRFPLVATY
jgi:hypothetical protein